MVAPMKKTYRNFFMENFKFYKFYFVNFYRTTNRLGDIYQKLNY